MSLESKIDDMRDSLADIVDIYKQMLNYNKANAIANIVYQANQIQCWRDFADTEVKSAFFDAALKRHQQLAAQYGFALGEVVPANSEESKPADEEHY